MLKNRSNPSSSNTAAPALLVQVYSTPIVVLFHRIQVFLSQYKSQEASMASTKKECFQESPDGPSPSEPNRLQGGQVPWYCTIMKGSLLNCPRESGGNAVLMPHISLCFDCCPKDDASQKWHKRKRPMADMYCKVFLSRCVWILIAYLQLQTREQGNSRNEPCGSSWLVRRLHADVIHSPPNLHCIQSLDKQWW